LFGALPLFYLNYLVATCTMGGGGGGIEIVRKIETAREPGREMERPRSEPCEQPASLGDADPMCCVNN
jgi:hypothetical protein